MAKATAAAAIALFASLIARSDAQPESAAHPSLDTSRIVGTSYGAGAPLLPATQPQGDASLIASAQSMLTTTKTAPDGASVDHVAPLRIESRIELRRVTTTPPQRITFSPYLEPGRRKLLHAGVSGIVWITERVTRWDDVVVGREPISREVVRAEKPSTIAIGTPKTLAQLRAMLPRRAVAPAMTMVATAYTADTATAYPTGYTATGILAQQGVVAVDPHVIPLGTTLFIPGYGIALAADTGGAIIGHRIDLCMDRYGDAIEFGRQTVQVYVIKQ